MFAVVITQFVATLVGVDGNSMLPGLRNRERVFVPKYETWLHKAGVGNFKRGDIVEVKNTTGEQLDGHDGLGDWNIPWKTWSAGNADQG